MTTRSPVVEFIIKNQKALIQIDLIKELFMIPDRLVATSMKKSSDTLQFTIPHLGNLYEGKLFVYNDKFYSVHSFDRIDQRDSDKKISRVIGYPTGIIYDSSIQNPLCTPQDVFELHFGDISNSLQVKPFETTIGRFIANVVFYVYPFGDKIPYLNDEFTDSRMKKEISSRIMDKSVSIEMVKDRYINTLSLFSSNTDIFCPNITEKTVTIPKEINALREKLVSENKAALERGDTSVMSAIENKLIKAYREYLKNDPSMNFLLKSKYFNVTLKKLFLTQGMTEIFGSPGKFTFIDNPMGDGWKVKDLPAIFNEVRHGSYSRAVETANGGVIAKLILRVLQDTRITIPDCGTTRGGHIHATKDVLRDFLWNYIVNSDGTNTLITEENTPELIGKDLIIRSPGYCESPEGFCAKCFGHTFEEVDQKSFAPVANDFARNQVTSSLKRMHGSSHNVVDITDINRYLIS